MDIVFRPATAADLPGIVAMLADDPLGARRESPDDAGVYRAAFERITADPNQLLVAAEGPGGELVGTMQLSFLPGLSHRGATRCQIEAVRVRGSRRGGGLGGAMIEWALEQARARGARMVQLTSDASRADAHRFYERLGFTSSHVGFKRAL